MVEIISFIVSLIVVLAVIFIANKFINKIINKTKEIDSYYNSVINRYEKMESFEKALEASELPIIKVKLGDKYIYMLIDTGANLNYMCQDLAKHLSGEDFIIMSDSDVVITGSCGESDASQQAKTYFSVGNIDFIDTFQCMDMSHILMATEATGYPCMGIIGSKFLSKHKWVIDYKENIVKR